MRIAFDVDETLIPYGDEFATERSVPLPFLQVWFPERLREGAAVLLRELTRQGWDVWIYTTSGRGEAYFRVWFALLGIRLGGVVNCDRHEKVVRDRQRNFPRCSKYPPAFGIDLLVDNSDGVAMEGKRCGFAVLLVDPDDPGWADKVRGAVRARRGW